MFESAVSWCIAYFLFRSIKGGGEKRHKELCLAGIIYLKLVLYFTVKFPEIYEKNFRYLAVIISLKKISRDL